METKYEAYFSHIVKDIKHEKESINFQTIKNYNEEGKNISFLK